MSKTVFDATELFILVRKDDTMSRLTGKEIKYATTDKEVFALEARGFKTIAYIQGNFGFTIEEGEIGNIPTG